MLQHLNNEKIDEDCTWSFKEFVFTLTISSIFLHQSMYIGFKGYIVNLFQKTIKILMLFDMFHTKYMFQ